MSIKVADRDYWINYRRPHPRRQFVPGDYRQVPVAFLSYTTARAGGRPRSKLRGYAAATVHRRI